jgi:copper transport protein
LPDPTPLTLTGGDLLAGQLYGAGLAPQIVALPATAAGQTRLAVGFPAEARYAQLTLHQADRIVEEVQADPKHLIRRTLVYPDAEQ